MNGIYESTRMRYWGDYEVRKLAVDQASPFYQLFKTVVVYGGYRKDKLVGVHKEEYDARKWMDAQRHRS